MTTKTKSERIADGLFVETNHLGCAYWVLRYKHAGKWHKMGLGPAHDAPNRNNSGAVTKDEALTIAAHAHRLLANGIDPMEERWQVAGLPPSVKRGLVAREATKKWAAIVAAQFKGGDEHAGDTLGDPQPASAVIAHAEPDVKHPKHPACATTIARCAEHIGWLHRLAIERGVPEATRVAEDVTALVYSLTDREANGPE